MIWLKKVKYFSVSVKFNISTISSFKPLCTTLGGDRHMPSGLFYPKFDAEKLLFQAFFGILRIFGSVQPKSECIFLFLYNLIFKPDHLSSPLAPLWGEIDICPRGLFYPIFNTEKLLFEAFFGIVHILTTVRYIS